MKKRLRFSGMLLFAMVASFTFTACSDDDGGGVTTSKTPSPTLTDKSGNTIQLNKAGNNYFNYNNEGKLVSFGNSSYYEYEIEGDEFTIKNEESYGGKESYVTYNIELNSLGFISKVNYKGAVEYDGDDEGYGGYNEYWEGTVTYNYNSNGELIGMNATEKENGHDYDWEEDKYYNFSASYNVSQKFTWVNGDLISSEYKSKANDGSIFEVYNDINYSNDLNPIKQNTLCFAYIQEFDLTSILSLIGLLGVGTTHLPTRLDYSDIEKEGDYEDKYDGYKNCSYSLNNNGTIKIENGRSYSYGNNINYSPGKTRDITDKQKKFKSLGKLHRSKHQK